MQFAWSSTYQEIYETILAEIVTLSCSTLSEIPEVLKSRSRKPDELEPNITRRRL
jgi:hypothetical protein